MAPEDDESAEDIHLIMEYKRGESWGDFTAPRANRWVRLCDDSNPKVRDPTIGCKLKSLQLRFYLLQSKAFLA